MIFTCEVRDLIKRSQPDKAIGPDELPHHHHHYHHHHHRRNSHYSVAKLPYNHVRDICFYALTV